MIDMRCIAYRTRALTRAGAAEGETLRASPVRGCWAVCGVPVPLRALSLLISLARWRLSCAKRQL